MASHVTPSLPGLYQLCQHGLTHPNDHLLLYWKYLFRWKYLTKSIKTFFQYWNKYSFKHFKLDLFSMNYFHTIDLLSLQSKVILQIKHLNKKRCNKFYQGRLYQFFLGHSICHFKKKRLIFITLQQIEMLESHYF